MRLQGLTMTINTNNGRVSHHGDNSKTFKPAERHNLEFELEEMEVETSDYEAIFSGETKVLDTLVPSLKAFFEEVDAEDEENHANRVEILNSRIKLAKEEADTLNNKPGFAKELIKTIKSDLEW